MSMFLKHVGILKNTSKRVVIVFHEIPGTTDRALVCDMEALPPRMHDAVMGIVESQEAQRGEIKDIYELLARRLFPDTGVPVINELHNRGYLQSVAQNNVIVMPRPNVQIPLDILVSEIKRLNSQKRTNTQVDLDIPTDVPPEVRQAALQAQRELVEKSKEKSTEDVENVESSDSYKQTTVVSNISTTDVVDETVEKFNQHLHNQNMEKTEGRIAIARNLLKQAELLSQEANSLIKKALAMAPELDPNSKFEQSKVQTTVTREKVVTNSDIPKPRAKSPGRPRRSVNPNPTV